MTKLEARYGATIPVRPKEAPDYIDLSALQAVLLGCAAEPFFVGRTSEHVQYMQEGVRPDDVW